MKIEITKDDKTGELEVWQDGKTTGPLVFGEMLEQVIRLLSPLPGPSAGYAMKTPQEWLEQFPSWTDRWSGEVQS